MTNFVELHQRDDGVLVNLNNVSMIIKNTEEYKEEFNSIIFFNDDTKGLFDETYEQLRDIVQAPTDAF